MESAQPEMRSAVAVAEPPVMAQPVSKPIENQPPLHADMPPMDMDEPPPMEDDGSGPMDEDDDDGRPIPPAAAPILGGDPDLNEAKKHAVELLQGRIID